MRVPFLLAATILGACAPVDRLKVGPSRAVVDRAFLSQWAATRRFELGHPEAVRLTPDGRAVLFLRSGPRSFVQDLYEVDTTTGKERVLLAAASILSGGEEKLTAEERARRERMRVRARGITSYQLSGDGNKVLVPLSGRVFLVSRAGGAVVELAVGAPSPLDPRFSPDGRHVAFVREGDLFVIDVPEGSETTSPRRLTRGATDRITHGVAEFVAQEEMGRHAGYWWSPDSRTIAYQETDNTDVEVLHVADATHPERSPRSWPYPRPGKANARVRLGLVPVTGGKTTWVDWDRERYPYLATVRWSKNAPLTLLVQDRTQTEEALLRVSVSGATETLLVEKDEAWLNLDQRMPLWLGDGSAFLWTTERNGAWRLELRDPRGALLRAVTAPDFSLREVVSVSPEDRTVVVSGGDDPTQRHLFRVSLDEGGAEPRKLTEEPGLHGAVFSRDHDLWVHAACTATAGRRMHVRRADGSIVTLLQSVAEEPPFTPNVELTTVGESPRFHAAIVRPRSFESEGRYPVVVAVYGGPRAQVVTHSRRRYLLHQWIADHGFIVVSLDGRGTPGRGRAWERAIKGDLIDLPLADQVAGLQALGQRHPEMDLGRVGIFGWSFGGYFSAMAVMRRPDVFHVGVAGAPVADWRDYDTHYTERYMGLPDENRRGYQRGSVLTWARELSRPLLIVHGTVDDNVYFTHSLKMSDALFRAGKAHQFLPLSGFTHMVPDPLVTERLYARIVEFLGTHLRGASPSGSH